MVMSRLLYCIRSSVLRYSPQPAVNGRQFCATTATCRSMPLSSAYFPRPSLPSNPEYEYSGGACPIDMALNATALFRREFTAAVCWAATCEKIDLYCSLLTRSFNSKKNTPPGVRRRDPSAIIIPPASCKILHKYKQRRKRLHSCSVSARAHRSPRASNTSLLSLTRRQKLL